MIGPRKIWWLLGLASFLLLSVGIASSYLWANSLHGWAARYEKPGYKQLLLREQDDHFVAVYDAGHDRLALLLRRLNGPVSGGNQWNITDASGEQLLDISAGRNIEHLFPSSNRFSSIVSQAFDQGGNQPGLLIPIRHGYSGTISVECILSYSHSASTQQLTIRFPWNDSP